MFLYHLFFVSAIPLFPTRSGRSARRRSALSPLWSSSCSGASSSWRCQSSSSSTLRAGALWSPSTLLSSPSPRSASGTLSLGKKVFRFSFWFIELFPQIVWLDRCEPHVFWYFFIMHRNPCNMFNYPICQTRSLHSLLHQYKIKQFSHNMM